MPLKRLEGLLDFYPKAYGIERVGATISANNHASCRVAEKCGAVVTKTVVDGEVWQRNDSEGLVTYEWYFDAEGHPYQPERK